MVLLRTHLSKSSKLVTVGVRFFLGEVNTGVCSCGTVSHILFSLEEILLTVASDMPAACAVRFPACVRGKSGPRLAFSCKKYLFTL